MWYMQCGGCGENITADKLNFEFKCPHCGVLYEVQRAEPSKSAQIEPDTTITKKLEEESK